MRSSGEQLGEIAELIDASVLRPIVDRTYPFSETPAALAHVDVEQEGKVIITTEAHGLKARPSVDTRRHHRRQRGLGA